VQHAWWYDGFDWSSDQLARPGSAWIDSDIAVVSRAPNTMEIWWTSADHRTVQGAYFFDGPLPSIHVSATETQTGPDICVSGVGFPPGETVRGTYLSIPGRGSPQAFGSGTVKSDGSFNVIDTSQRYRLLGQCSADQIDTDVVVTVPVGRLRYGVSGTIPGAYWCANAPVSTNFNGGC
jgi:hypothetical protein